MGIVGFLILVAFCLLLIFVVAPHIPHPGDLILRWICWIVLGIALIYFLVGLLKGTSTGYYGPALHD